MNVFTESRACLYDIATTAGRFDRFILWMRFNFHNVPLTWAVSTKAQIIPEYWREARCADINEAQQ